MRDRYLVEHARTITQLDEGAVRAVCGRGWRSPVFGTEKTGATMDPLQHADEAGDPHEREVDLSGHDVQVDTREMISARVRSRSRHRA